MLEVWADSLATQMFYGWSERNLVMSAAQITFPITYKYVSTTSTCALSHLTHQHFVDLRILAVPTLEMSAIMARDCSRLRSFVWAKTIDRINDALDNKKALSEA